MVDSSTLPFLLFLEDEGAGASGGAGSAATAALKEAALPHTPGALAPLALLPPTPLLEATLAAPAVDEAAPANRPPIG